MWNRLLDLFHPFAQIAQELRTIRELYELELSERRPPIIRVTEKPSRYDTEVIEEIPERPKSALGRIKEVLRLQLEDDDDEFPES